MLAEAVAVVTKNMVVILKTQQVSIVDQVGNHLTKFIGSINEVKSFVEVDTYALDPIVPLVVPDLVPPIKVQIHGCTLEIGTETSAFDDVIKDFDTLQMDFSKLSLGEVYELQRETVTKV